MRREVKAAMDSVNAILDNAAAVRGERFGTIVRLAVNIESLVQVAIHSGAPGRMVRLGWYAIMCSLAELLDMSEEDFEEVQRIVRLVHSQTER